MMGLMLWITSFNCCRTSLLLLLSNVFLKVIAVYFKADSTISGAFQCSACSVGAPPTHTPSTINFLGVKGPFLDQLSPYSIVWGNCCLTGRIGAYSQLLKCFSKLLPWLVVLPLWKHFSFCRKIRSGTAWAQLHWRRIWHFSCTCVGFFLLDTASFVQFVACPSQP